MGVISRDYSPSGLHPALGFQPKHPGKTLALLPRRTPQPHGPLASHTNPNDDRDHRHRHQLHRGFAGNQLTLVELHLHHDRTRPTGSHGPRWFRQASRGLVVSGRQEGGAGGLTLHPRSLGSEPTAVRHTPHSWLSDTSAKVINTKETRSSSNIRATKYYTTKHQFAQMDFRGAKRRRQGGEGLGQMPNLIPRHLIT